MGYRDYQIGRRPEPVVEAKFLTWTRTTCFAKWPIRVFAGLRTRVRYDVRCQTNCFAVGPKSCKSQTVVCGWVSLHALFGSVSLQTGSREIYKTHAPSTQTGEHSLAPDT
jgi:hypothetical protein